MSNPKEEVKPYTEEVDIYDRKSKLEKSYQALEDSKTSEYNKKLIKDFVYYKSESDAPSPLRQSKYLRKLSVFGEYVKKDFDKLNPGDVEKLVKEFNSKCHSQGGSRYKERRIKDRKPSQSTKLDNIKILKAFLRYYYDESEVRNLFKKVPIPKVHTRRKKQTELWSWNEAVELSKHTTSMRDMALIQFLRDTGVRIEEALTLKVCDIERKYNGRGVVFHIRKSKTESGIRNPALRRSGKTILDYLETSHPFSDNPEAVLFCKQDGTPITETLVRKVFRQAKEKAGINKRVYPHLFRASNISEMSLKYSDAFVKTYHGLVADTRVLKHYQFTDEEQMNQKLLVDSGILKREEEDSEKDVESVQCNWCREYSPPGVNTCSKCGRSLNPDVNAVVVERCAMVDRFVKESADNKGLKPDEIFQSLIELAMSKKDSLGS